MDGKIHPSGFVQQGGDLASLVTAYAALRPRDGFSHPHQEHMKDTYSTLFKTVYAADLFKFATFQFNIFLRPTFKYTFSTHIKDPQFCQCTFIGNTHVTLLVLSTT